MERRFFFMVTLFTSALLLIAPSSGLAHPPVPLGALPAVAVASQPIAPTRASGVRSDQNSTPHFSLSGDKGRDSDLFAPTQALTRTVFLPMIAQPGLGLRGTVRARPRWAITSPEGLPLEYQVILDVSGSMSWNFAGQAGSSSNPIDCTIPNPGCEGAWNPVQERRIYIVKEALKAFIDQIGSTDIMRVVAYSGNLASNFDNQRAIDQLTETLPASGWSSDKAVLKSAVTSAGAVNADPYRTDGLAPSATAFAAAAQVLATAPITAPNGLAYRRVTLLLTDSVANVFRDGEVNNAEDICPGNPAALDTAQCQVGTTAGGRLRPLSAMVDQADALKQLNPTPTIYVVALAGVDTTGLGQVVSAPNLLLEARQPATVSAALGAIQEQLSASTCVPAGGDRWVDHIDVQHTPVLPPPDSLPAGVFGYVYLYDQDGISLPGGKNKLQIVHDPVSGALTFGLPASQGLAPGTYRLRAFVGYKGDDSVTRVYLWIVDALTLEGSDFRTFQLTPAGTPGQVVTLDGLDLDLRPPATVCP